MRKIIKIIISIILILFLSYMLTIIIKKVKHKSLITEQIQTIPQFLFVNISNNKAYTNKDIENNKACLIIYYNSECNHCEYEAEQISTHIDKFENYQILMISYESLENILAFKEKYKLNNNLITFLQDPKYQFDDIFGNSPIPTSFIYNKNRKLVKQFKGEVKIETLLKYLAQ